MKLTRRGLFKTIAGAFVVTKTAPLLPVAVPPPPVLDALNSSELLFSYRPMFVVFQGFGPVTFDGGDKITQSLIYEVWPPDPSKCHLIKNTVL